MDGRTHVDEAVVEEEPEHGRDGDHRLVLLLGDLPQHDLLQVAARLAVVARRQAA